MHDPHHELPTQQGEMTADSTRAARYPVGPSKGRPNGEASAPGVAEALGRQGAPEQEQHPHLAPAPLPRAADEAALHRVARRRQREPLQRCQRVDVRYSTDEKTAILAKARSLNIAAAHYVAAVVTAHLDGDLSFALPGQRTPLDDYIDELSALRHQVTKIGHNVNQIARKLNVDGHPHPGDTATLDHAERTLHTVSTTVSHIAHAANQAVRHKPAS